MAAGQIGASLLDSFIGMHSADQANRTNIRLAREQRAWEEKMSNTAVGRRARDLESSGFNRLLAATGPGASTPSVSAPTVEPIFRPGGLSQAAASAAQAVAIRAGVENTKADTVNKLAQARITNVEADLREELKGAERDFRANRFVEEHEWNDLKTKIMRSQDVSSAAEAKRAQETADAIIATIKQQQQMGKLDLEALKNLASIGGTDNAQSVIKLIIDFIRSIK